MLKLEDIDPRVVTHKPTCQAPALKVRPGYERGVSIVTCRKCSTYGLADENGARILDAPDPTGHAPAIPKQFRCPVHGTPVTWRGTGCAACQHDRNTYRARRIQRRAAEPTNTNPEGN